MLGKFYDQQWRSSSAVDESCQLFVHVCDVYRRRCGQQSSTINKLCWPHSVTWLVRLLWRESLGQKRVTFVVICRLYDYHRLIGLPLYVALCQIWIIYLHPLRTYDNTIKGNIKCRPILSFDLASPGLAPPLMTRADDTYTVHRCCWYWVRRYWPLPAPPPTTSLLEMCRSTISATQPVPVAYPYRARMITIMSRLGGEGMSVQHDTLWQGGGLVMCMYARVTISKCSFAVLLALP